MLQPDLAIWIKGYFLSKGERYFLQISGAVYSTYSMLVSLPAAVLCSANGFHCTICVLYFVDTDIIKSHVNIVFWTVLQSVVKCIGSAVSHEKLSSGSKKQLSPDEMRV